jgi:hypothetical protein
LKLKTLTLGSEALTDLSPLKGMPLESLALFAPEVGDLSALSGMPLKSLQLNSPEVRDLSALHGMPLETLWIKADVRDLSPLKELPLQNLFVDVERLAGNVEVVKGMKNLKRINHHEVESFWKEYEATHPPQTASPVSAPVR